VAVLPCLARSSKSLDFMLTSITKLRIRTSSQAWIRSCWKEYGLSTGSILSAQVLSWRTQTQSPRLWSTWCRRLNSKRRGTIGARLCRRTPLDPFRLWVTSWPATVTMEWCWRFWRSTHLHVVMRTHSSWRMRGRSRTRKCR
jgi:hypothetical protein